MKTHNFKLVNADTDSIMITKPSGEPFTEEEQESLLVELNSNFPEKIKWEDDGFYESVVVLKAKNYILKQQGKTTKKGSSLKSSKIEPRLKDFMGEIITQLLDGNPDDATRNILGIYHKYVREVHNLKDISGFCSKKTVTDAVLNPGRTTEQKILDAIGSSSVQMGDKIYVYYSEISKTEPVPKYRKDKATGEQKLIGQTNRTIIENPLVLREHWSAAAPDHSIDRLLGRLYNTLVIFENVIDIAAIPKYHLKSKKIKDALKEILDG